MGRFAKASATSGAPLPHLRQGIKQMHRRRCHGDLNPASTLQGLSAKLPPLLCHWGKPLTSWLMLGIGFLQHAGRIIQACRPMDRVLEECVQQWGDGLQSQLDPTSPAAVSTPTPTSLDPIMPPAASLARGDCLVKQQVGARAAAAPAHICRGTNPFTSGLLNSWPTIGTAPESAEAVPDPQEDSSAATGYVTGEPVSHPQLAYPAIKQIHRRGWCHEDLKPTKNVAGIEVALALPSGMHLLGAALPPRGPACVQAKQCSTSRHTVLSGEAHISSVDAYGTTLCHASASSLGQHGLYNVLSGIYAGCEIPGMQCPGGYPLLTAPTDVFLFRSNTPGCGVSPTPASRSPTNSILFCTVSGGASVISMILAGMQGRKTLPDIHFSVRAYSPKVQGYNTFKLSWKSSQTGSLNSCSLNSCWFMTEMTGLHHSYASTPRPGLLMGLQLPPGLGVTARVSVIKGAPSTQASTLEQHTIRSPSATNPGARKFCKEHATAKIAPGQVSRCWRMSSSGVMACRASWTPHPQLAITGYP
ncbi:hypothetical protein ABBQ38_007592 [Trebouxia sp. C0009 RCD-2024]